MTPFIPMDAGTLAVSIGHFQRVAGITSVLIGVILVSRIALLTVTFGTAQSYGAAFRDTLTYLVALSIFPALLRVAVDVAGSLALAISFETVNQQAGLIDSFFDSMKDGSGLLTIVIELGKYGVVYIARAIYTLLLAILIAIGPVVLLLSTLVNGSGVLVYFNAIGILLLWPVVWNLLGALAVEISKSNGQSSFGLYCFWFVVQLLQFLSPLFSVFIVRSLAPSEALKRPMNSVIAIKTIGQRAFSKSAGGRGK